MPWALGLSPALRPVSIKLALNVLSVSFDSLFSEDSLAPTPRSPVSIVFSPRSSAFEF